MIRWFPFFVLVAMAAACGGSHRSDAATPTPVSASPAVVDPLWTQTEQAVRHGKWKDVLQYCNRLLLQLPPGDPRIAKVHYYLGEAYLSREERLEAAREFRKASDDTPNDPIAPEALLRAGDAYAELWRRPELDPSYGQTALATYQEVVERYPNTPAAKRGQAKIAELNNWFAYKAYRAALYYYRLKAYDSAILYLKDLVATYPRASVAPEALIKLVQAYRKLGYREDLLETCGYIRRYHPGASGVGDACPADTATADAS